VIIKMAFEYTTANKSFLPPQVSTMANSLYHSLKGQYFTGYADNMYFARDKNAWAGLFNPVNSGGNLFINVWTVTDLEEIPLRMQIWINATIPGDYTVSDLITPANTAMSPVPQSIIELRQAENAEGTPLGGYKAFVRRTQSGETVVSEEEGKFIIPPGGNFSIFLSNTEGPDKPARVRVAFGWWHEGTIRSCDQYMRRPF
jgi:hypothetical protein